MAREIDFNNQFASDDSDLPDIFGEDEEYYPANEALDDDVDNLGKVDGSNGSNQDSGDDNAADDASDDSGDSGDDDGGGDDNLAAATDQQLKDDSQSADDESLDGGDAGDDSGDTDMNADANTDDTTGSDPLRSIDTKIAYKKKFTMLYGVIIDSITTMESFSPAYNNKTAGEYYEIENGLSRLKDIIYDICTAKINKMTVDSVLHQYTLCNIAYDTLTRKLKEFSDKYNAEQRKLDVSQRVKDTASKLAKGNKLLGQKRPTTK